MAKDEKMPNQKNVEPKKAAKINETVIPPFNAMTIRPRMNGGASNKQYGNRFVRK